MAKTRYVGIRLEPFDYEWYEKLAKTGNRSMSEILRDALQIYRGMMQLPGIAVVRPLGDLRTELVRAYEKGGPIADLANADGRPKARSRRKSGTR